MPNFDKYDHFKNYCFKIMHNKQIQIINTHYKIFDEFKKVVELIEDLKNLNIIEFKNNILDQVAYLFKSNNIYIGFSHMKYFVNKICKIFNREIDFYYLISSLNTMLDMKINFISDFINIKNTNSIFFPGRLKVLEVVEDIERVYAISTDELDYSKIYGVYFIYDSKGKIAYIGKSTSCAISRSFYSAKERKLLDFSKIEIRETKTKSDVGIYEAYYISKYKPYCNREYVYEDNVTIELPELKITKTFNRNNKNDSFTFKYNYIISRVYDTEEIMDRLGKDIFVYNESNKRMLERKGYLDKDISRERVYQKYLEDIQEKGYLDMSALQQF